MALSDPVAVYNARDNVEADSLRFLMEKNGIEAFAVSDDSIVGVWMFGLLPQIHKPQLWVNRRDADRARAILIEYEEEAHQRWNPANDRQSEDDPIEVVCEECGKRSVFPASKLGAVQDCPFCSAYVDVGEIEFEEDDPEFLSDS